MRKSFKRKTIAERQKREAIGSKGVGQELKPNRNRETAAAFQFCPPAFSDGGASPQHHVVAKSRLEVSGMGAYPASIGASGDQAPT